MQVRHRVSPSPLAVVERIDHTGDVELPADPHAGPEGVEDRQPCHLRKSGSPHPRVGAHDRHGLVAEHAPSGRSGQPNCTERFVNAPSIQYPVIGNVVAAGASLAAPAATSTGA